MVNGYNHTEGFHLQHDPHWVRTTYACKALTRGIAVSPLIPERPRL